jgi:O-antigen/teichoic acid export membrane protein
MSNENRQAVSSGLKIIALSKLSTQIITWGMTFFVLRILDPSDYGLVAISAAITMLFGLIAEFGLSAAIIQAKSTNRQQLASLFGYGIVLNICIVAVLQCIAPLVVNIYADARLEAVIRVASLQFLLTSLCMLPDAKMQREMNFRFIAKLEFTLGVFTGVCTLILAYSGYGYWSLVISPLFSMLLRTVLLNLVAQQWVRPRLSIGQTRGLLVFGSLTLMTRFLGHLLSQTDVLIAGLFLTKEALGMYAVAMQLATMPLSKIMSVINQVAFPELSRMNREEGVRGEVLMHGGRMVLYLLFPVLWGLAAVAPFVVHILMGDKWEDAILPLQLVCIALPLRAISGLCSTALSAVGRVDIVLWNVVIGFGIFPVIFYYGAQYGVVGVAWAWVISTPLFVIITLMQASPVLGLAMRQVLRSLISPALSAGAMYLLIYLSLWLNIFQTDRVDHFVYATGLGALFYGILLRYNDPKIFQQFFDLLKHRQPLL